MGDQYLLVAQSIASYITPQEYLEWEETQEERHEYHDGVIVAMSGGSRNHSVICNSLASALTVQLRSRPCETHSGGIKVYIEHCNRYFYPDTAVICGQPAYTNNRVDSVSNPIVVVEVLSESTEHFDRTIKLDCYGTVASIHSCLLVSQREHRIEKYSRISGKPSWEFTAYTGIDAVVPLPEIDCELRASEVYERIEFAPVVTEDVQEIAQ